MRCGRWAYLHMFLCYRRVVVDRTHRRTTTRALGYVPCVRPFIMNTVRAGARSRVSFTARIMPVHLLHGIIGSAGPPGGTHSRAPARYHFAQEGLTIGAYVNRRAGPPDCGLMSVRRSRNSVSHSFLVVDAYVPLGRALPRVCRLMVSNFSEVHRLLPHNGIVLFSRVLRPLVALKTKYR